MGSGEADGACMCVTKPTNVRDVSHPELIDAAELRTTRQIQIDLQFVMGIRSDYELSGLYRQQVVLPHEPYYALCLASIRLRRSSADIRR